MLESSRMNSDNSSTVALHARPTTAYTVTATTTHTHKHKLTNKLQPSDCKKKIVHGTIPYDYSHVGISSKMNAVRKFSVGDSACPRVGKPRPDPLKREKTPTCKLTRPDSWSFFGRQDSRLRRIK